MPFIEWDERFITGIRQFDEHHQLLVGLLNTTYDDFMCGAPDENIGSILNELVAYAGYHFEAEEAWMREHSYPKILEHTLEHDSFLQRILALKDGFYSGKEHISLEVLTLLKRWLKKHLLDSDTSYSHFASN